MSIANGETLATLVDQVRKDDGLPPTRQRDLLSDLNRLADLLERPAHNVPADLRTLRPAIAALHHARLGLSRKRLQNIKASLLFVCQRYDVTRPVNVPLSGEWQALAEQLTTKRERDGLITLFRYCSAHSIAPTALTDAVTADWLVWLQTQTLRKKPKQIYRQACRIWNEVRERGVLSDDGEALPVLTVPNQRAPSFTLPWSAFDPRFVADVEAYCSWLSGKDLFAEHAPARPQKPSSIALRRRHIGILASAAITNGFPLERLTSLADLTGQEAVRCALAHYQTQQNGQFTTYVRDLVKVLVSITWHWVRDEPQVTWLKERLRRMGSNPVGLTPKNRATLRQFDDLHTVALLLGLPARLMVQSVDLRVSPARRAVRVQLALAINLLTVAPMRLSNLAALRIDTHVAETGTGRQRRVFISIAELAIKNGVPLEFPLPAATADLLQTYLRDHRPHLADAANPWLFPGEHGQKQSHTLGQQIKATIHKEIGVTITPHQFRHVAAKLYLDQNPGHYEVVRRLLGHKSTKTTMGFYTGLETRAAVAHYDATLERLRDLPSAPRPRRRQARVKRL